MGLGGCHQEVYEWPLEEDTQEFIRDLKEFATDGEVAKINDAVVDMASTFTLGVDEGGIEELLEVVPEQSANELLEHERILEENARERNLQEKKNKNTQENVVKGF